ncbi:glutamine amidotransferase class-I domain-containing protein [Hirsutella rhossiliensis]|uniref:CTP synthase n=1 Tax=Hirsutella rhossiliensis TaxID=111463 RepID=A0A9P8N2N6_9HYPO|nr:glutamine amidotransferase class-I domain-containing protein [Hirsutella rhossiliensis]KAH0963597.1 glutamine amidotransferase class-I domain-containing protein [Hirsutella rhossiliensis]
MKYVLVSGGVVSGVGKGIIASSAGLLLKTIGLKVTAIKIDPYINVDAGTMNPKEHGECFVLKDGGESDLDLGNYERYLGLDLTRDNNITTGKIYKHVIERERRGDYLGRTVQVVPHVTSAIIDHIERVSKIPVDGSDSEPDVCIVELGGTVGDIESMPFVEALTQLQHKAGKGNFINILVSYIPIVNGEQKTKPTQYAVKSVRSAGLIPDLIACRCERPLEKVTMGKIAQSCQVEVEQVVAVRDMPTIYQVPILLEQQGLLELLRHALVLDKVSLTPALVTKGAEVWKKWNTIIPQEHSEKIDIALVGKYVELPDAYLSVVKSLEHSTMRCGRKLNLIWVDSEQLEDKTQHSDPVGFYKAWHQVSTAAGILVPGGFGQRGTEGMIKAAQYARERKRPFLGICLGMQIAVIEYARHVCGKAKATSEEFDAQAEHRVIIFMPEGSKDTMGGTMRLGSRATHFQPGSDHSKLRALYGEATVIEERHRHRYEVNPDYVDELEAAGMTFVGKDDSGNRMEVFELHDHPWFVGVQYHPEYLSRVLDPSRPYLGFVAAAAGCLAKVTQDALKEKTLVVNGALDGTKF